MVFALLDELDNLTGIAGVLDSFTIFGRVTVDIEQFEQDEPVQNGDLELLPVVAVGSRVLHYKVVVEQSEHSHLPGGCVDAEHVAVYLVHGVEEHVGRVGFGDSQPRDLELARGLAEESLLVERVPGLCGNCSFRTLKLVLSFNCNIFKDDYLT